MNAVNEKKPAVWFWIISAVALLWNLLGVMAFVMQLTMSDEAKAKLPELEQTMYASIPSWYMPAFGLAVVAGALGCLCLLLRKKLALLLFILSLIGIAAQQLYMFGLSDIGKSMNGAQLGMTLSIPVIAVLVLLLAKSAGSKGWLR